MDQQNAGNPGGPAAQAEPADLSARTVTTLVLLTLVISFLGAWMNIHQAESIAGPAAAGEDVSSAQVTFRIEAPPEPQRDDATGLVAFRLQPGAASGAE